MTYKGSVNKNQLKNLRKLKAVPPPHWEVSYGQTNIVVTIHSDPDERLAFETSLPFDYLYFDRIAV